MATKESTAAISQKKPAMPKTLKRVVFTMGGKGGTGKTTVMSGIAEYLLNHAGITPELIDLDWENKGRGTLHSFFPYSTKVDIRVPTAYDILLNRAFQTETDVVLADLGAGSGIRMYEWFDSVYAHGHKMGLPLRFTAVGVVDDDPASRQTILEWANHMQDRVQYLIVLNRRRSQELPPAWIGADVEKFTEAFSPVVIQLDNRVGEIEQLMREHKRTLSSVVDEGMTDGALNAPATYIRIFGYREALFQQLAKADTVILP
jgi:MinD-like ATPase involved in chromosome partitioning or flagellar assembly